MKKKLIFILIALFLFVGTVIAGSLKPYAFPFIGRWQPSEDPVLIDDYGFQDIQNLRKDGRRLRGVSGHTKINTTVWPGGAGGAYLYPKNGFHFRKDQPYESHVIISATDSAGDNPRLYQNTTAIPSQGNFSGTVLHTADTSAGPGRMSAAPKGNMAYCDGEKTLIWGGDELTSTAFIVSTLAITNSITNPKDFSDEVMNTRQTGDEVAYIMNAVDCDLMLYCNGADASTTFTNEGEGTITAITIAFVDSNPDTITDSGSGFVTANMVVGSITVSGSTSNDGTYVVDTVAAGTLTLAAGETLTGEVAGDSVTITMHPVTANGDAQVDTDFKKFGSGSLLLDGTGDYLSIPDSAAWHMGTGKVTVDVQFKPDDVSASQPLFQQYTDGNNRIQGYWVGSSNQFVLTIVTSGSQTLNETSDTVSLQNDTLYHFALIRGWGGNANDWAFCLDGVEIGTFTNSGAWHDEAAAFEIGRYSTATYFSGHIDEFRITKGVARWTSDFNAPTSSYKNIGRYWIVGTTRPIQGLKYYVNKANSITSTMTAKEWNGASWADLSITDNTASGGVSLAQTGTVTWSDTEDTSEPAMYIGMMLYWYQFALSAGEAEIYHCTVDAPIQTIKNIWSTDPSPCTNFAIYLITSVWKDYTLEVNTPSSQEYSTDHFAAKLDALADTSYVYIGFIEQVTAINFNMTAEVNTNASVVTVEYWDGAAWTSVGTVTDGTDCEGNSLAKSGYISWNAPERGEEFPQNLYGALGASYDLYNPIIPIKERSVAGMFPKADLFSKTTSYYYKLSWSAALSATVNVDTVEGVTVTREVPGYKFPALFQNRLFLFSEEAGLKNTCAYSAYENPDSFNGKDSGYLFFGDNTEIMAAASLYNLYHNATGGIEQLIVAKQHETYRISGNGPMSWQRLQMSSNIGCIAPLSMATCDLAIIEEGVKRQVVIWQTDNGVAMTDGATIKIISKDIACYWDANDSRCIPTGRLDDSVGFYDPELRKYKLLISSGSGQTTHNVELEYAPDTGEWTKLYRENGSGANPLQIGFVVHDTAGKAYTFGATDEGYMYRLENGNTWDGTAITQYVHTKDLMLDSEKPLMTHTNIHYLRLIFEDKATGATEDIDIIHYNDQVETSHGTNDQAVPTDIDIADGPHELRGCTLGPALYHSFKFTAITSTVADGMELTGMGLYYEPKKTPIP